MASSNSLRLPQELIQIRLDAAHHAAAHDLDAFGAQPPSLFGELPRSLRKGNAAARTEYPMPGQLKCRRRDLQCVADHACTPGQPGAARHPTVGCDLPARNRNDGAPDEFECLRAHARMIRQRAIRQDDLRACLSAGSRAPTLLPREYQAGAAASHPDPAATRQQMDWLTMTDSTSMGPTLQAWHKHSASTLG